MRPHGSPRELEARRVRSMALLEEGRSLSEVARMVGAHASSVMRWRNSKKRRGQAGLKAKPASGRPPKLTKRQLKRLVKLLLKGAMARGHPTEVWTTQRIADLIEEEFGVRYHRDHIGRLLRRLDWSYQKPDRRALQRNEGEIERWKHEEWPRIKKGLHGWVPISSSSTNQASC